MKNMLINKVVLFPGLASDIRAFGNIDIPDNSLCVDYLAIDFKCKISEIINDIIQKYEINENDVLIAVSFGGLLASRVKEQKKCKLVLVGSMVNRSELGIFNSVILNLGVYRYIDIRLLPKVIIKYIFGLNTSPALILFYEMLSRYPSVKIIDMIELIRRIQAVNVFADERIHGMNDKLITSPSECGKYIAGGHIISFQNNNIEQLIIKTIA